MISQITSAHDAIILDACCVMNLYASNKMDEIVASISESVVVHVYVKDVEALTVYKVSKSESPTEKEPIILQPLIEAGLIIVVDFESAAEKISFVNLAANRLDDGEAATGAIALHRGWAIATDDRKCRSLFNKEAPHIELISTPQLIKHWADSITTSPQVVSNIIRNVEARANYLVGRRDHLYSWWQSQKM